MKKTILALAFSFSILATLAQDNGKTSIAIIPGSINNNDENVVKYAPRIVSVVSSILGESKRFSLAPTDNWGMPQDASETQYVSQARDLGINYIVTGNIDRVPILRHPILDQYGNVTSYTYSAKVLFSIKVINAATGEVFSTKNFDVGSGFLNMMNTEAAVNNAIRRAEIEVKKWINETFPVSIGLLRVIKKDDKGGVISVLISAGSENGISEGKGHKVKPTKFKIISYESETVEGKVLKRAVQIGAAEVDKVNDANFSECVVTEGRVDVAKKIDAGEKLFLITIN